MVALPDLLLPLAQSPATSALLLDFDGTLSPIVEDPVGARPLPGVPDLLRRLARRLGLVAVISGRPVAFLSEALEAPEDVTLVGVYGLELALDQEQRRVWEATMDDVVLEATAEAPEGVYVEPKGLTMTVHWRRAPEAAGWVAAFAERQRDLLGLAVFPARSSLELRPPVEVDKGTVVRRLIAGMTAPPETVVFFGDDVGDLPAFDAVGEVGARRAVRVAALDNESSPEMAARADLTVTGATGAVLLLESLVQAVG